MHPPAVLERGPLGRTPKNPSQSQRKKHAEQQVVATNAAAQDTLMSNVLSAYVQTESVCTNSISAPVSQAPFRLVYRPESFLHPALHLAVLI
jgi:hypothetical protein